MSLILESSKNYYINQKPTVYCRSGVSGQGFYEDRISINEIEIEIEDFIEVVMYVMTNTDLEFSDPRFTLKKRIENLTETKGFNGANIRYTEK
jgi:hypothetical protein